MSLARLRFFAIAAPGIWVIVVWTILHKIAPVLHKTPWLYFLGLGVLLSIGVFAFFMFRLFNNLERHLTSQNAELEHRNRELQGLLVVGHAASSALDLRAVLERAMDTILEVTSASTVEIWLRNGDVLDRAGRRSRIDGEPGEVDGPVRLLVGERPPGLAAARRETVFVPGGDTEDRACAYCALPLTQGGEVVGVLGVASCDAKAVERDPDFRILAGIGERVAVAIAHARLHEQVLEGAVLEERVRIAHELHDGLAQVLGFVNTKALAIKRLMGSGRGDEAVTELESMVDATRTVYADVRQEILGLRSSRAGPRGLVPSLRQYVEDTDAGESTSVVLEVLDGAEDVSLSGASEIQLVRIVQEALSNVRKHADARRAVVRVLCENGGITVAVADDGRGFDTAAAHATGWPHFGLKTMGERALAVGARLDVDSAPGRGTTITVHVPLGAEADWHARPDR